MELRGSILVVDDERDVLDMVCQALEDEGYQVICANHPNEVASVEGRHQPSLFFVDLMLPEMSGIDLARHLRRDGFPETPMVAMSASSLMLNAASSTDLFQGTLAKPFDLDSLLGFAERYAA